MDPPIVPLHCVLVTGCVTISRLYHTVYIKSCKFTNNISNTFYIKGSWILNISLGRTSRGDWSLETCNVCILPRGFYSFRNARVTPALEIQLGQPKNMSAMCRGKCRQLLAYNHNIHNESKRTSQWANVNS